MKIHSFILTISVVLSLVSCATLTRDREIKQNGAIIHYKLPHTWIVQNVKEPSDHYNIITPADSKSPSDPSITIDFYNQFDFQFPQTEKGCADSYLYATQGHKDPAVKMSKIGSITSPIYGAVSQYRYFSDYFGDHLISFIVTDGGYVTVELWTKTAEEREIYTKPFQEIVQSLSVTR